MFCTVKCAALYGAEKGREQEWCREHKCWYYFDEGCPVCDESRPVHPALR